MNQTIEIMAPAGNFETLAAAVQGGAGSVYFGIEQLNMRAKSTNNFTIEDLSKIADICSQNNIYSYLAVNTIIYDHDIKVMKRIVDAAKKANITAIIASDQAVINYARRVGVNIHLSTQLNVSNTETVKFYSNYADVMVLARELSLKQVKHIADNIKKEKITGPSGKLIKLEIFIHGALCMAISGKCYLSLHEQNSSANRGACMQTCRKGYTVTNNETGYELDIDNEYIMSPKDLSVISFLDKVLESGVSVLKIEGRARPGEYVKTVTECYREAAESVENGSYTQKKINDWTKRMSRVFNRGFWDGYYLGRKLGEWSKEYGSKATHKKIYIAKTTNWFSNIGVGEFLVQSGELSDGDELLISGPTTGVIEMKAKDIHVDRKLTKKAVKGEKFSIAVPQKIRRADKLYKIVQNNSEHGK
ncbi:MAG: peptidase U32 family protein [Bacteroidota bacterium]|nr:peptidase U32 family protein [Bacteroidota bacterium]